MNSNFDKEFSVKSNFMPYWKHHELWMVERLRKEYQIRLFRYLSVRLYSSALKTELKLPHMIDALN